MTASISNSRLPLERSISTEITLPSRSIKILIFGLPFHRLRNACSGYLRLRSRRDFISPRQLAKISLLLPLLLNSAAILSLFPVGGAVAVSAPLEPA